MKIIIFGSNGFIGKSIIEKLAKTRHKVICFDLSKNSIFDKKIEYYQCHLSNIKKYERKIKNADIFLNLVGFLGVEETQTNPYQVLQTNLIMQIHFLNQMKNLKIKKLVFTSSSEVFGDINISAVNENSPKNPKSDYAISKLSVEHLIIAFSKKFNFKYNILRYFNVYGPNQRDVFVIPKFIKQSITNQDLTVTGKGDQVRTFCYIDDAADATIKVMLSKNALIMILTLVIVTNLSAC